MRSEAVPSRARLVHERTTAEEELRTARDQLELKVAERTAELERSEWYLAEAQRLTRTGSVALDVPTWEVLHSSAEHSRLYGFDPEREVPSLQDFTERIHPEDRRIPSEALGRGVRERATAEAEYRVVLPNGEERRFLAIAHPVFDASGRIDQFMCTVMDITERRRAESELARLAGEQAALRRVATLVARETPPEQICAAVAEEVGRMLGVDHTSLSRFEQDGTLTCLAGWGRLAAAIAPGTNAPVEDGGIMAPLLRTGRPNRVDHDEHAVPRGAARSAIATPIVVDRRLWGAIAATSMHDRLPADTGDRLGEFTELVATAIANVDARSRLAASRARLITEADAARRRVVRDLHDGAQQRLVHTILTLELALRALQRSDGEAEALTAEALACAQHANAELRELAHGILPANLTGGGLRGAVEAVVQRLDLAVEVDVPPDRFAADIEASAYFVVAEALTNVMKHAHAEAAAVSASVQDGMLRVEVRDDGIGGADPGGHGLVGMDDRVTALGGRLSVESPPGAGTVLTATFPSSPGPPDAA